LSATGNTVIYYGLGVGAGLFLIAIWGCIASRRRHRLMQCIYFLAVLVCLAASIAAAIIIGGYGGKLDPLLANNGGQAITDASTIAFNNAALSFYVSCCNGCAGSQTCVSGIDRTPSIYEVQPPCNQTTGGFTCGAVGICPNTTFVNDGCFRTDTTTIPTAVIATGSCQTFGDLRAKSTDPPLIGYGTQASAQTLLSCGKGDPKAFVSSVATYVQPFYNPVYIATSVFAALQAVNFLAAATLVFCTRDPPKG